MKKVIFSGIQPSGMLTLGNYVGAIRNWVKLEDEYECYFCVVDMHAMTVRQDPAQFRKRTKQTLALLIACGLSAEKSAVFMQSHVSAHAELAWVLNCNAYMGELSRMTQFKEKSGRYSENINAGLFTYPVLMAADILLYQAALVPVGADQKQHLELSRDIAIRFNNHYGETFVVPEPYIPQVGARVMSLQEPDKKMSKSDDNPNAYIGLLDTPDEITRKFKRAVTDSEAQIRFKEDKPGVSNLIAIHSACTGKSVSQIEQELEGEGYGALKAAVAESVIETLRPVRQRYDKLMSDGAALDELLAHGAKKAAQTAAKTLKKVYRRVGLS